MTARLLSLGGAAQPISLNRLATAAGRIFTILLAVYLIRITRTDERLDEGLLLSFGVFVGLYLVFGRRGVLRPVILYIIATAAFAQVRLFADQTGIPTSFTYVVDLERAAFGGVVPTVWLQEHFYEVGKASLVAVYASSVYLSYFVAFQIAALAVWLRKRSFFPTYATSIVLASYIGLMTCLILPTAPPWMAGQEGHIAPVHRVVEQLLSSADSSAYDGGSSVVGVNQVAAMPSLHMALTVLVMLTVWRFTGNRFLRLLSVAYAASMAFALVYLGEHYATDEFFGVITAGVAWYCANRVWSADGTKFRLPKIAWRAAAEAPAAPPTVSTAD